MGNVQIRASTKLGRRAAYHINGVVESSLGASTWNGHWWLMEHIEDGKILVSGPILNITSIPIQGISLTSG